MIKTDNKQIEVMAALLLTFEYEILDFIPNFTIRMDTAKQNAITLIIDRCNCKKCKHAISYINNLNFNEHE